MKSPNIWYFDLCVLNECVYMHTNIMYNRFWALSWDLFLKCGFLLLIQVNVLLILIQIIWLFKPV